MPLRCQVWTTVGNTLFYQHFNQRDCRLNLGQLASDFSAGVICNLLSYDLQRSRCYAEKNTASRCVQKGTHCVHRVLQLSRGFFQFESSCFVFLDEFLYFGISHNRRHLCLCIFMKSY